MGGAFSGECAGATVGRPSLFLLYILRFFFNIRYDAFEELLNILTSEDETLQNIVSVKEKTLVLCKSCRKQNTTTDPYQTNFTLSLPKAATFESRSYEYFRTNLIRRNCETCKSRTIISQRHVNSETLFLFVRIEHNLCSFKDFTANKKINISNTIFFQLSNMNFHLPLSTFLNRHAPGWETRDRNEVNEIFARLGRVEILTLNGTVDQGILRLHQQDANLMFGPPRRRTTVAAWYRQRHATELTRPEWPLVYVLRNPGTCLPVEVVTVMLI
eukprot:NP_493427.1 Uncharacterized protein CELE_Y71A12B.2 [Caenorhabditis elegans]